jgi:hypothetical protein
MTMVDKEPRGSSEVLDSYWTFEDVLMLGIANLPEGINRLTADYGQWAEVVENIKREFSTRAPELFRKVHFSHREPLPSTSDQLDDFFFHAGLGGILPAPHPAHLVYDLREETKEYIKRRREPKLHQYAELISEVSTHLQALAV